MRHLAANLLLNGLLVTGCAFTTPYVGQGPHPQVTRGTPIPPLDVLGNILSLLDKLILWNWNFNSHEISPDTEQGLIRYLEFKNLPVFEDTKYRLNQYSPLADLHALVINRQVAWPYRLLVGLPLTLIYDVLLPGRIFPWGDYFNPYTNTAHLYSDDIAIALHEAGHAYDFADFPHKGTYALIRLIPFVDLYQEWRATDNAVNYLVEIEDRETEFHAYRTLWPAYGTYLGGYFPLRIPIVGAVVGAIFGHGAGRTKVAFRRKYYERMDAVLQPQISEPHVAR